MSELAQLWRRLGLDQSRTGTSEVDLERRISTGLVPGLGVEARKVDLDRSRPWGTQPYTGASW